MIDSACRMTTRSIRSLRATSRTTRLSARRAARKNAASTSSTVASRATSGFDRGAPSPERASLYMWVSPSTAERVVRAWRSRSAA